MSDGLMHTRIAVHLGPGAGAANVGQEGAALTIRGPSAISIPTWFQSNGLWAYFAGKIHQLDAMTRDDDSAMW